MNFSILLLNLVFRPASSRSLSHATHGVKRGWTVNFYPPDDPKINFLYFALASIMHALHGTRTFPRIFLPGGSPG